MLPATLASLHDLHSSGQDNISPSNMLGIYSTGLVRDRSCLKLYTCIKLLYFMLLPYIATKVNVNRLYH